MLWWVLVRGRLINFSGLWRAVLLFTEMCIRDRYTRFPLARAAESV